jgi:glucan phosphoethanolaminetransferase (alkaline phosphatase superfamily)
VAVIKALQSDPAMKSLSLLIVLLIARGLVLAGKDVPLSVWSPLAFLWQDLLIVLIFAFIEAIARRAWISWLIYGLIVLYTALNVPLERLLASPLTWTMMRAARGTLADSIAHYFTWWNFTLIAAIAAAGFFVPKALQHRRVSSRQMALPLLVIVAIGPWAARLVETNGLHRNAVVTLMTGWQPRVAPSHSEQDWRRTPLSTETSADLQWLQRSLSGRNVILVMLESTGADHLKLYGAKNDPTPNLTALARHALIFDSAYAVYPESIKGLFSVLCSQYPAIDTRAEIYERIGNPSLPEIYRSLGYRTALFHSGRFMYLGMEEIIRARGYEKLADAGEIGGNHNSSFGVDEPATVGAILHWLDCLDPREHFFLTYLPIAGHHPYQSPEMGPFPERDDIGRYRNALYYGDQALGVLIEGLKKRGRFENTVFVMVGDHGEAFGQHEGNYGHTLFIYEENVRVPMFIAAPGVWAEPRRVSGVASLVDVAPTVLDLMGIERPKHFQGESLLMASPRMALFYTDYSLGWLGLRDAEWKFIYEIESARSYLFNLKADPGEEENLSWQFPERCRIYAGHLKLWSAAQRAAVLRGTNLFSFNRHFL